MSDELLNAAAGLGLLHDLLSDSDIIDRDALDTGGVGPVFAVKKLFQIEKIIERTKDCAVAITDDVLRREALVALATCAPAIRHGAAAAAATFDAGDLDGAVKIAKSTAIEVYGMVGTDLLQLSARITVAAGEVTRTNLPPRADAVHGEKPKNDSAIRTGRNLPTGDIRRYLAHANALPAVKGWADSVDGLDASQQRRYRTLLKSEVERLAKQNGENRPINRQLWSGAINSNDVKKLVHVAKILGLK